MSENDAVVWVTCCCCCEAFEVPLELLPDGKDPGTWLCEICDREDEEVIDEIGGDRGVRLE